MRRLALLFLASALAGGPLRGQEPTPDEEPPDNRRTPDSGATSRPKAADPSSTLRVVTRSEIENSPFRSLPEILQWVVGLDVRRRGVEGVQADVGMRGADHNSTLILVDGEPMLDPQSNHHAASLDVPYDAIERIEVLSGPAAAARGAGAVGGVVNVVTRGASLRRARFQFEGRFVYGTDSLNAGGIRAASKISDSLALAADWARLESSGFQSDTEFAEDFVRGSARWETAAGPLSASFGYGRRRFGAWDFYGSALPNQQETTQIRTAGVSAELTFGGWTLAPSVFWRAFHDDYVLDRTNPSLYENLTDTTTLGGRLSARRSLAGGTVVLTAEAGGQSISSSGLGEHSRSLGALLVEYCRPFDTAAPGRAGFRAGLRADDYSDFGAHLSPWGGVWYAPSEAVRLRASAGTAFRVPTWTELYYRDPQNVGNPSLVPEKAVNAEAGLTVAHGPFSFDAAGFWRHGAGLIDFVRSSSLAPWVARNIRTADTWGLEAALQWQGKKDALLSHVVLQAAYLFVDLAQLSAEAGATQGKYVLDPLHVKWDLIAGGLLPLEIAALTRLSYFARPSYDGGVWLWDLRLARDLLQGEILEVYVEGRNLGDAHYQEALGVPLPGRTLLLGLRLTW
jgi:iron complex outermembrane receptor protein